MTESKAFGSNCIGANDQTVVGRFAPSPSGRIHAGNILAYLCAWLVAQLQGGRVVLRIEDLDSERSKSAYAEALMRDLERLGLTWDEGPYYQQNRDEVYAAAFDSLSERGLTYPCFCTRADLHAASAPHPGERFVYPGTCRSLSEEARKELLSVKPAAWRLLTRDCDIAFTDELQGPVSMNLASDCGDFVIRRFDGSFAYQLAVVVDDAEQGVTSVVRGYDLLDSSPQQRYLQDLLGLPHVEYAHVPLVVAPDGRRLSKRNRDAELESLLGRFGTPEGVIGHISYLAGLIPYDETIAPDELLCELTYSKFVESLQGKNQIVFS